MAIMMIGYSVRRGYYRPEDVQVFNRSQRGGAYWFARGVNWCGMGAWIPAGCAGPMFANTPLIAGPWNDAVGGVGISLPVTPATAALLYVLLLLVFPEPRAVFGPEGPRPVPCRDVDVAPVTAAK
jgi:purine-cytosine permease-like protein